MPDHLVTIISALIGAGVGSLGATIINDFLRRRGERLTLRKSLANRYLLQLQDAIESLWHRLANVKKGGGGGEKRMEDEYYEVSTLYAFACVLAYKRILLLDGVYSQLDDELGRRLKEKMREFDSEIEKFRDITKFVYYDRLALAEAVMERDEEHLRTCPYIEFKKQYQGNEGEIKSLLKSAKDFVSTLKGSDVVDDLMKILREISNLLNDQARIASNLPK